MGGSGLQFFGVIIVLFILFGIYFVFKQVQFVLQAIDLYKKILNRQDTIIKILIDIRDNKKTSSGIFVASEDDYSRGALAKEYDANSAGQFCGYCGAKLLSNNKSCPACKRESV